MKKEKNLSEPSVFLIVLGCLKYICTWDYTCICFSFPLFPQTFRHHLVSLPEAVYVICMNICSGLTLWCWINKSCVLRWGRLFPQLSASLAACSSLCRTEGSWGFPLSIIQCLLVLSFFKSCLGHFSCNWVHLTFIIYIVVLLTLYRGGYWDNWSYYWPTLCHNRPLWPSYPSVHAISTSECLEEVLKIIWKCHSPCKSQWVR